MNVTTLLSPQKTMAIRGVCALAIFVFHILIFISPWRIFHFWGGMFVAVFLILSGYGINESYHKYGLSGYWRKRFDKVILPSLAFASCFCLLNPQRTVKIWTFEVLYLTSSYWFVFHILKCYVAYWLARRFLPRHWGFFLLLCAVACLNYRACNLHLESEQSFSFLFGVLLSERKAWFNGLSPSRERGAVCACFLVGLLAMVAKSLPAARDYLCTVPFNYLLCPFRLAWGIVALYLLAHFPLERSRWLAFMGKYSLEAYISHIPLIRFIAGVAGVPVFMALSVLSFSLLCAFTSYVQRRLTLSLTLYLVVNALFVAKYSARLLPVLYPYVTFAFIVVGFLLISHGLPAIRHSRRASQVSLALAMLGVAGMLTVQYAVDPYQVRVDRWSALHFPIKNLLSGVYPYLASTHLGGHASPFPVWQAVHIPFYLLGNVGLSFFVALGLFLWSICRRWGRQSFRCALLLLVAAPAVWYEVSVRSDLITNFLLLGAFVNVLGCRLSAEWLKRHVLFVSVFVALFASTRLLTLLPFGLLLLPCYLKLPLQSKVLMPVAVVIVFLLTFLPFAWWDWQDFFHHPYNPWTLQTRQGHVSDFLLFIPLFLVLALKWQGKLQRYNAYTAFMLVCIIGVTFVHNMFSLDNWDLFSSTYDITYFNSLLPFAVADLCLSAQGGEEGWGRCALAEATDGLSVAR